MLLRHFKGPAARKVFGGLVSRATFAATIQNAFRARLARREARQKRAGERGGATPPAHMSLLALVESNGPRDLFHDANPENRHVAQRIVAFTREIQIFTLRVSRWGGREGGGGSHQILQVQPGSLVHASASHCLTRCAMICREDDQHLRVEGALPQPHDRGCPRCAHPRPRRGNWL
jgi:hypothetical protein